MDKRQIVDKVILAATAGHAARKARELVQRKTVLSGSGLPGKLADCSDNDPAKCEIFLVCLLYTSWCFMKLNVDCCLRLLMTIS